MLEIKKMILDELSLTQPTGATTHQEGNFMALLEPKLRKVFYETYAEVPEQYSKIFNVKTSSKAKETDYHLGAMKGWTKFGQNIGAVGNGVVADGDLMPSVHYQKIAPGGEITYIHSEYAEGFMVERKFIDDEQYSVIEKMTGDLARAGRYLVEETAASVLNNAFTITTQATHGFAFNPTGKGFEALVGDHNLINSDTKVSNHLASNAVLAEDALKEAILLGRKQVDQAGKLIVMNYDTLVIAPEQEFIAQTLNKSTHQIGNANNDVNLMKGRFKIVVNPFLNADAWFLQDSKRHELNFFWRVKPEFGREKDFDTFVSKYRGYMRFSVGFSDWRGVIGSKGTGVAEVSETASAPVATRATKK